MGHKFLNVTVALSKIVAVLAIGTAMYVYWMHFKSDPTKFADPGSWGQLGDFFGGVLNPLLAFGAFYWVATSVKLQKEELSETRKALLDSQRAQQHQADTTLLAARIETLNVKLSRLGSKLEHLRQRESHLHNHIGVHGAYSLYYNEEGMETSASDVMHAIRRDIHSLVKEEDKLLEEVDDIGKMFPKNVHASYSN